MHPACQISSRDSGIRSALRAPHGHRIANAERRVSPVNRFVRDYGLGIVLAILFFLSWIGQSLTGWVEFAAEQQSHG